MSFSQIVIMKAISRFMSLRHFSAPSPASALTKRRRFYKEVGIVEEKSEKFPVYKVTLDGRILKTQAGQPLQVSLLRRLEDEPVHIISVGVKMIGSERFVL
ncbi:unnamed protein product [Auanema sp. JU1783]|nr:unnamed protein product [Auanema sp. JU1783]